MGLSDLVLNNCNSSKLFRDSLDTPYFSNHYVKMLMFASPLSLQCCFNNTCIYAYAQPYCPWDGRHERLFFKQYFKLKSVTAVVQTDSKTINIHFWPLQKFMEQPVCPKYNRLMLHYVSNQVKSVSFFLTYST